MAPAIASAREFAPGLQRWQNEACASCAYLGCHPRSEYNCALFGWRMGLRAARSVVCDQWSWDGHRRGSAVLRATETDSPATAGSRG